MKNYSDKLECLQPEQSCFSEQLINYIPYLHTYTVVVTSGSFIYYTWMFSGQLLSKHVYNASLKEN